MGLADFLKNDLPKAPVFVTLPMAMLNPLRELAYGPAVRKFKKRIPSLDPEQMLVTMANHAIAHVPYYRERYSGTVITSADQFRNTFGFIDKQTVMEDPDRFISDDARNYITVTTSGSTGTPLKMLMPANRYITEMAFVSRAWQMQGWNYGKRATVRMAHLPEGKDYYVNPLTREFIFSGVDRSDEYIRKIHKTMTRYGIHDLYAYSMSAYDVLKRMAALGLDTSVVRNVILTSEAVTDFQHHLIHDTLGINVIAHYGHTEKLICARSLNGLDNYLVEPAYGFTELIDFSGDSPADASAEGGYGELVGSTFYNFAMPLLRYRSGDSALSAGQFTDSDGISKLLLKRIDGRSEKQKIYRHDGSVITAPTLIFHSDILEHIDGMQFVQDRRGYLRCIVKPNALFSEKDIRQLHDKLDAAMLGEQYWTLETHGDFIKLPSGKFPYCVNNTL